MAEGSSQILVVGSHSPGLLMRVHRAPVAGETVLGWGFEEPMDGGKGSHQAMVAARLGTATSFVGCLGRDRFGAAAVQWLQAAGVDVTHVGFSDTLGTGLGFILLDDSGVPAMVSSMGANEELSARHVDRALAASPEARVLLTQFEIRPAVALYAAQAARRRGLCVIINPAPAVKVDLGELGAAHVLTPNETEARMLLGYAADQAVEPADMAAELKRRTGTACVIITLGDRGATGVDEDGAWQVAPTKVQVVDTSGAGDVFCGALAVAIVRGKSYREAAAWAGKVAALSVTRAGTIPSFPTAAEVAAL